MRCKKCGKLRNNPEEDIDRAFSAHLFGISESLMDRMPWLDGQPRYAHRICPCNELDCDKSIFLGRYVGPNRNYDLWICFNDGGFLFARYGDDNISYIKVPLNSITKESLDNNHWLKIAYIRAKSRVFI